MAEAWLPTCPNHVQPGSHVRWLRGKDTWTHINPWYIGYVLDSHPADPNRTALEVRSAYGNTTLVAVNDEPCIHVYERTTDDH